MKRSFQHAPIRRKLTITTMLTTVVAVVIGCGSFLIYDVLHVRQSKVDELQALADVIGTSAARALTFDDVDSAHEALATLKFQKHVIAAFVYTPHRVLYTQYVRPDMEHKLSPSQWEPDGHHFDPNWLTVSRALMAGGRRVGSIQLLQDLDDLNAPRWTYAKVFVLILVVSLLIAFVLAARLQRLISGPILRLAEIEKDVTRSKDFSLRGKKETGDEIGLLVDTFNEMLEEIQTRDRDLRIAKERAEESNRTKSAFLANMSHELRTPLNAIIGYSEMLSEEAADSGREELVNDLQKIHAAGKHLLALINDVLDLSKIEAGKMDVYAEPLDIAALIGEIETTMRPALSRNGNELTVKIAPDIGIMSTDTTKVRQIVLNLLSNANKFTQSGHIVLDVAPADIDLRQWVRFRVEDTGIGISSEQMSRLFQPFGQADASTTRKYGGTGLGLAISRRFGQMLGGDITVQSEVGRGSVFTLLLPRNLERLRTSDKEPAAAATAATVESSSRPKILVVDDDESVRELVSRIGAKEGFDVLSASTGEEALALAGRHHPDVIVLDVLLPGMNGWAVLTTLKADPDLSSIPVVILTMVDDKKRALAFGASEFVVKPVDRARLVAALQKFKSGGGATVLVVEDERDTRSVLRQALEKDDWSVAEADNGARALEWLERRTPNVILLDLLMPEMDGFTFIDEVRTMPRLCSVPIVVLTAKDLSASDRSRLSGGVQRILQKGSYTHEQLESTIRSAASAHWQERRAVTGEAHG